MNCVNGLKEKWQTIKILMFDKVEGRLFILIYKIKNICIVHFVRKKN